MANIKIPKDEWEVFSTTYATPVDCPRCGHRLYVHLSEYGNVYKKYYPGSDYDNFVTDHCDMCGEQLIVEMVKHEETDFEKIISEEGLLTSSEIEKETLYKVVAKDPRCIYAEKRSAMIKPYNLTLLGNPYPAENWCQVVVYNELSMDSGTILHCGEFKDCAEFLCGAFLVRKED